MSGKREGRPKRRGKRAWLSRAWESSARKDGRSAGPSTCSFRTPGCDRKRRTRRRESQAFPGSGNLPRGLAIIGASRRRSSARTACSPASATVSRSRRAGAQRGVSRPSHAPRRTGCGRRQDADAAANGFSLPAFLTFSDAVQRLGEPGARPARQDGEQPVGMPSRKLRKARRDSRGGTLARSARGSASACRFEPRALFVTS